MMATAIVIKSGGETEPLLPANGREFNLDELQLAVGGYIELVYCGWSRSGGDGRAELVAFGENLEEESR